MGDVVGCARVLATRALAALLSLSAVFPLRGALLDVGVPALMLLNGVGGSRAARRRRPVRREGDSAHDPTTTSSEEDDDDWEDEDHEGVSLRRLRFGSELVLLQLVDTRPASMDSSVTAEMDAELGTATAAADGGDARAPADAAPASATSPSRRRRAKWRRLQLSLLQRNKVR